MPTSKHHKRPVQIDILPETFRTIFEQSPYSIQIFSPNGDTLLANSACQKLWGLSKEQISNFNILRDKQLKEIGLMNEIEKAFKGETIFIPPHLYEPQKTIKESIVSRRFVQDVMYPIKDSHGDVLYIIMQHEDVTEKVELEQRKDDFLSIASHELKTPITTTLMFLQLLHRQILLKKDLRSVSIIEKIDKQLKNMTFLINELLDLTKIQHNQLVLKRDTFSLPDLLSETVENLQMTTNHHIAISHNSEITLYADRDRLSQVLVNLISNAIKYTPLPNTIIVSSKKVNNHLFISVQDFGIGIAKSDQEKIFERFFRAEGEQDKTYPGFGIGLYISQNIITRHHGTITVKSKKGEGSIFTVKIPISS